MCNGGLAIAGWWHFGPLLNDGTWFLLQNAANHAKRNPSSCSAQCLCVYAWVHGTFVYSPSNPPSTPYHLGMMSFTASAVRCTVFERYRRGSNVVGAPYFYCRINKIIKWDKHETRKWIETMSRDTRAQFDTEYTNDPINRGFDVLKNSAG